MKKRLVRTFIFVLMIGICVIGVVMYSQMKPFGFSTNNSSESALIQDRLVELSELTTLKYEYSKVIISRSDKSLSLPGISEIKYAEAIKLIEYSGYLKAGSDLSKLEVLSAEGAEQLSVRVPKAQILDNVAVTETAKVTDIKGNIFSDYPSQKILDDINADKKQLVEEKIKQGFLEEADKRTKEVLTSILSTHGHSDVVIEFY